MKTLSRRADTRMAQRARMTRKLRLGEALEQRQVMANDFLAGTAFIDANSNGQLDAGDSYLQGATIELRSIDGSLLYSTSITDANGAYIFTNVAPREYAIVNRSASGYVGTASDASSTISPLISSTSKSISVDLRSPTNLQASVDVDQFLSTSLYESVKVSILGQPLQTNAGLIPTKLFGLTSSPDPSEEFLTLSVDLFNGLSSSGINGPYEVNANAVPVGTGGPINGQRVAYLYNQYIETVNTASQAAGLQLAIWELLYDNGDLALGPLDDLVNGNFIVDTTGVSPEALAAAEWYLTDSLGKFEAAVFLNVPGQPGVPETNQKQSILASGSFNFANKLLQIGNRVWHDLDVDGIQSPSEPGIPGAKVKLLENGSQIAETITDSLGEYAFTDLLPGTYVVHFELPDGFYAASPSNNSIGDTLDSDGPEVTVTVTANQANDTIDQGFYKLASLGDFVWNDRNGNGFQDQDEEGIPNARVNLFRENAFVSTAVTNGDGLYTFRDIEPGVYRVEFEQPVGYALISPPGFESGAFDSDGPIVNGVNLESGENETKIDQGFYNLAILGDFVWHDEDADGVKDLTESGIDGVTVSLLDGTTVVEVTQTAGGGFYSFNVSPGTYTVRFTRPDGFTEISPTSAISNLPGSDGLTTLPVTIATDEIIKSLDIGFYNLVTIGDFVWHDQDADGVQDSSEPGIDNVAVNLIRNNITVASTQTANGGKYEFKVAPGTYSVQFVQPANFTEISPPGSTSDSLTKAPITLLSGQSSDVLDQGFYNLATIGDFVWDDKNANGVQDIGDNGIDGVTVRLIQGTNVTEQVTANGGKYSFRVVPGTYTIEFTKPGGFPELSPLNVGDDNLDSDGLTVSAITVTSGEVNNSIDLGLYNLANIGDFVWEDKDADGVQDGNETGIDGVTVRLIQGTNVTEKITAGGGKYSFSVIPGTYSIEFVKPSGFSELSPLNVGDDNLDSDGLTVSSITVTSGEVNNSIDLGLYNLATIGDFVWEDKDADGVQDGNETGIDGVTVRLIQGTNVTEKITAGGGKYSFSVIPGTYSIEFVKPSGFSELSPLNVGDDNLDSDGLTVSSITVTSGEVNNSIDLGLYNLATIGDFVWEDKDADGVQDGNETGIDGVTVRLIQGTNVTEKITAGGGKYSFSVIPGTYSIEFVKPSGFSELSPLNVGDDNLDSDGLTVNSITVTSGEVNNSIDLGLYNLATIGDFVWEDKDADGVQDGNETGIDGVTVRLIQGTNVTEKITAGGGKYSFSVIPGTYSIEFVKPSGFSELSPLNVGDDNLDSDGLTVSSITVTSGEVNNSIDLGLYNLANIGDFVWEDKDADGIQDGNETGIDGVTVRLIQGTNVTEKITAGGGKYSFNVIPGTYSIEFVKPSGFSELSPLNVGDDNLDSDGLTVSSITVTSGEVNNSIDLGLYNLATIGDFVWEDKDADGVQDGNETGIDGVTVRLIQGTNVTEKITSGGGKYSFSVIPGTYSIEFVKPSGFSELSPLNVGDDNLDSDGLTVSAITVTSGEVNNSIDLGLYNLATIGDFVWEDKDADGIQDGNETGIDGVTVRLIQGTNVTEKITAGGGKYSFRVIPGTYSIEFVKPSGFSELSPLNVGDDNLDSDGLTVSSITVTSGEVNNSIDLGLYNLATIGDFVWEDKDADGVQDGNETGIDGVTVRLIQGTNVTEKITAGGGKYSFRVIPGTYSIEFVKPSGFSNVSPSNATDDSLDSDGPSVASITLISGQINNTIDQGFFNPATNACVAIDLQGNTATSGTRGNLHTFSSGGVTVNASAFSRNPHGVWAPAYLGAYGGGLGVTDIDETGAGNTHTVDNIGNQNYILFEFSQQVVIDSVFLGFVSGDSDLTAWIGNVNGAFTNRQTLSDAFLTGLGYREVNTTTLTNARTADINARGLRGNILVIAADVTDTTPEDYFKIQSLALCVATNIASASIGDFVWHDINGNGLQESTEPGIHGATVTLTSGGADGLINGVGDTTATTTTDAAGEYNFANLTPGTQYRVTFSLPSGYDAVTATRIGNNRSLDSDGLTSDIIVLTAGETNSSIDAGFYTNVKVGNYVWNDADKDGLQERGEVGISGVQVTLSGTTGSGATITQSTTTAANGSYQFGALPPGTYTVSVAPSNFAAGGALVNFVASPSGVGADRGLDSNAIPAPTTPATLNSGGSDMTVDFGYYTNTSLACVTMKMEGNTSTSGTPGNTRIFSAGGISMKARAFARDSWGSWSSAFLGSYPGGLGVTDNSEGSGRNGTHTLDNVGRHNYILFEFSQVVTIDSAFLGYIINDSDLTAWIGTATDPFNTNRNLSDSYLTALGYSENNDTTLTTSRTADLNAGNRAGNVLVIAASTTGTQNDWFKLAELSLCASVPTSNTTKFFVVDDDTDKTFKYTSAVQYTSNFAVGPTSPTGIAANPAGTHTWVSDIHGRVFKYDTNGGLNSSWHSGITGTQGVATNGTSIWTVSNSTDRVYFYSGAANFTPSTHTPNPTLTSSFRLHFANTNPRDLATDGFHIWVVDDGHVDLVYTYTIHGSYLGRWQIDSANSRPTGITIDPSGGSKIWIVDAGTDRIYEYSGATGCRSGGLIAARSYALNAGAGNSNPQGIADPPIGESDRPVADEAIAASLLVDGSYVNPDINPYYNQLTPTDVNDDGLTTAIDALMIINRLNTGATTMLGLEAVASGTQLDFADVNDDGAISPLDALLVINRINSGAMESEQSSQPADPSEPQGQINGPVGAVDAVFGDLGRRAEGEAAAYLYDPTIDDLRRRPGGRSAA